MCISFKQQAVTERVIFAFTMSPQPVIAAYEHFTPDMQARIACAAEAVQWGFSVRLAFDPMIYCKDWENVYAEMLQCVDEQIDWKRLVDVSVGSFRISKEYLKNMRKKEPHAAVVQFPYTNVGGVYQYPPELLTRMEGFLTGQLEKRLPKERIFLWEE